MISLVYPHHPGIHQAPWSIGNALIEAFKQRGIPGSACDWDSDVDLQGGAGDILLGHPCPTGGPFLRALDKQWRAKISICPWTPDPAHSEWFASWIDRVDHALLISGPRWEPYFPDPWRYKITRLDMAIDASAYPPLTREIRPPGRRRCLYVGCTLPSKGTRWLEEVIALTPEIVWGHMGAGYVRGATHHGHVPLTSTQGRAILSEYDILVMPGIYDANPTTVLEAMALGLVCACTPGCGWDGTDVYLLPWHTVDAACQVRHLVNVENINDYMDGDREVVEYKYNWAKFTGKVLNVLEQYPK